MHLSLYCFLAILYTNSKKHNILQVCMHNAPLLHYKAREVSIVGIGHFQVMHGFQISTGCSVVAPMSSHHCIYNNMVIQLRTLLCFQPADEQLSSNDDHKCKTLLSYLFIYLYIIYMLCVQ